MARKRASGSSSSGASRAATTELKDFQELEHAADLLEEWDRPYAASLIRTFLQEQRDELAEEAERERAAAEG